MKLVWIALIGALVVAFSASFYLAYLYESCDAAGANPFVDGYVASARAPLFTAFLTLGSFLLTLKTSILQRLREGYDTASHRDLYLVHRREKERERGAPRRYYHGLRQLSFALSAAMGSAIVTSLLQVTLGFVKTPWSTAICVGSAAFSAAAILSLTAIISMAHKQWVDFVETEKQKEIEAILREERSAAQTRDD